ncbi:MAG: hypothetical protein ACI4WT_04000 [Oligosphaeraceae bacterium]
MAQVLFLTGTKAQYDALATKNENAIYFLTDTGEIRKGGAPFSHPVRAVEDFPETGETGAVYVNTTTHEARLWDGTAWQTAGLPTVNAIGASPTDTQVATAKAVKTYVDGRISAVNGDVANVIAGVSYANKSITVSKGTGDPVTTALAGLVDGASYDGATGVLTLTTNGGAPVTVNLPVENFLSAASFDSGTNVLTLTLTGGETVTVNLADLVDTYTGANGATANVSIAANGAVSASVNVSAQAGNIIEAKSDGIYAGIEWQTLA